MKIGAAFPSKYLKAADLQGRKVPAVIDTVEMANIGDDEDKLVVYFEGKTKGFVLNRTNANMITEIAGTDETDEWHGVKITLYPCKVDFQGRRVDAIRVDYPPSANGAVSPSPAQRPVAAPVVSAWQAGSDEEVPF